jgi:RNA polymerase sigma factor (TIGR02999 family)
MMRQILVDHARARRARKRGHGFEQVSLTGAAISPEMQSVDLIALDKALDRLAVKHPRPAKLVELRFFSGLSFDEAAGVLGVVRITAIRDWRFARAFLLAELKGAKSSG